MTLNGHSKNFIIFILKDFFIIILADFADSADLNNKKLAKFA